jgi:hypothetical protein
MRQIHLNGEKLFVDYSGLWNDPESVDSFLIS